MCLCVCTHVSCALLESDESPPACDLLLNGHQPVDAVPTE